MGLQSWPPNKPELSSMACLDVESPTICRGKFKSVLQHCLQQRRTREQLVDQGILPSLKSSAAFHKQIRSLQRARTGNFLKHKLCSRPERSELVRMHILEETQVEPSLQATQIRLKRARLANDLNEKIAQRPGPMELVEKKILPVDSGVEELRNNGKADYSDTPQVPDVYSFDEDSSDALSPRQPNSQPSPPQTLPSPENSRETEASYASSDFSPPPQLSLTRCSQSSADVSTLEKPSSQGAHQPNAAVIQCISSGPVLVKQTLVKLSTDKSRSKKIKEPKSRVKKLKYHQYIPPDQKQELSGVPMDSSYARLLEQQQQFLQLQILSLQQQKYNCQAVVPVTLNISTTEIQTSYSALALRGSSSSTPVQFHHASTKLDQLPANIDEMKVAELKVELKLRSLPVSGTKTDLIERLKLFHESAKSQRVAAMESRVTAANSRSENINVTPPVSLIASKVSKLGIEDSNMKDIHTKSDSETLSNAALCTSPSKGTPHQEGPTDAKVNEKDSEKDKRLHEKERQIEELMRKLEQEQKLVEELKMLLEVEKRSQQNDSPPHLSSLVPFQIKEENRSLPNCTVSCSSPGLHVQIKQEDPSDHTHITCSNQFINDQGTNKTAENLQSVQALLPTSLPGSAVAVELPAKGIKLHTIVNSIASGCIQASGHEPEKSAAPQQQSSTQTQHLTKTWRMDIKGQSSLNAFLVSGCDSPSSHQAPPGALRGKLPSSKPSTVIKQQTTFTNHASKTKDPPRYEDAVKQTRSMLIVAQGPTAASQQMDDLFDVLIESGEISPLIRQDPPSLEKPLPVTASVTTLPINTVLTRSPPLVQLAQLPEATLSSPGNNLETFLDDTEAQRLKLMEELNSPLVNMEMNFSENIPPSGVNLQNTSVDSMDWLDLTLSVPAEGINPLDMSVPGAVFSSDFLDSHELHLNWD
ncbi:myocardin-related transcription factor B-like isoform X1 [Girardinichthys multiradiatus]|uniref:myocardin-related transcription factor B-like isoform X1 n=1 Tax=Girardinichthys multiradiatus TaxID=208333 RepID=UPI001FAE0B32|nr:myocardin-related transcription factor B-like isoform X1 [Girardinichthys multiradiatus]